MRCRNAGRGNRNARDELVVITPPGHNLTKREDITLEQILRYPLILYDTGCEVSNLLNEFFRLNGIRVESLKVKMLMPDVSSSIIAVLEGLGLSFCPELLAKKAKRAGVSGHNSCPRCRECNLLNLHIKM